MRMKFMKKDLNIRYFILLVTMIIVSSTVLNVEAADLKRRNTLLTIYVKNDSPHGIKYGRQRTIYLGETWNGKQYKYKLDSDGVNWATSNGLRGTVGTMGGAVDDIPGYESYSAFSDKTTCGTYGIDKEATLKTEDDVKNNHSNVSTISHAGAQGSITITPPKGYVFTGDTSKGSGSTALHSNTGNGAIKSVGTAWGYASKLNRTISEDVWGLNDTGVSWTKSSGKVLAMAVNCHASATDGSATINIRPNHATITYDGDGGTGGAAGTTADFYYDETNNIGAAPSKTGYTFNGWYYDDKTYSAGDATNNTFVGADGASYTLTASWTETIYTIQYNTNSATTNSDGNKFSTDQTISINATNTTRVSYTTEVALPSNSSGISRPGYTLVGWSTSNGTNEYTYKAGQTVSKLDSNGGTVNLYAVWEPNTNYIVYNPNSTDLTPNNINGHPYSTDPSGTIDSTSYHTDAPSVTITSSSYTREGYKFKGWMDSYTSTTADYVYGTDKDKIDKPPVDGKTVYALWEPIQFTTEWYKGLTDDTTQDGIVMPDTGKYSFDQPSINTKSSSTFKGRNYTIDYFSNKPAEATHEVTNVPSQTKNNLTFNSWTYINDSGTSSSIGANTALGNITAKDDNVVKFTAKWDSYTKVFSAPYLHGWTYKGYSLSSGDANQSTAVKQVTIDPDTKEFKENRYASWEANRYYIVYDNNNGTKTNVYGDKITTLASGSMERSEVRYDHDVTLRTNTYTRPGYKFKEWNTKADGSGDSYADGALLKKPNFTDLTWYNNADTVDVEVKLYAIWEPIRYTVTFHSNDTSEANWNEIDSYKQDVIGKNDFRDTSTITTTKIRFDQPFNIKELKFNRSQPLTLGNGTVINEDFTFIGWGRTNNLKKPSTTLSGTTDSQVEMKNGTNIRNLTTPVTGNENVDLYALWYKDLELHFDMNGGKKSGSENKVTLSARIYNDRYNYTFHINNTKNTSTVNQDEQNGSIDPWGTYNAEGINKIYTKKDADGTQYRFLGWSTNPDAYEPDGGMAVHKESERKTTYTIYNDTTLYAVWEPVLMAKVIFKNNLKGGEVQPWVSSQTYGSLTPKSVKFTAGEQGIYAMYIRGNNGKAVGISFDSLITDIYNYPVVSDSLNPVVVNDGSTLSYCGLNKVYNPCNKYTIVNSFYIPMYLGTDAYSSVLGSSSYKSSGYDVTFTVEQDSFFYKSMYGTTEKIVIPFKISLDKKSNTPGYPGSGSDDTGLSVLDQLRTKLKIRIR